MLKSIFPLNDGVLPSCPQVVQNLWEPDSEDGAP